LVLFYVLLEARGHENALFIGVAEIFALGFVDFLVYQFLDYLEHVVVSFSLFGDSGLKEFHLNFGRYLDDCSCHDFIIILYNMRNY